MKFFFHMGLILAALFSDRVLAHPKTKKPPVAEPPAGSTFKIEKGLLESLYRSEIEDVRVESRHGMGTFDVTPRIAYAMPTEFELTNDYFRVPYSESGASIPFFHLAGATPLGNVGPFEIHGEGSAGYGYREAVQRVYAAQSNEPLVDIVAVHWIPLSLSGKLTYPIPGFSAVKPWLSAGLGAQWIQQSGRQDGISQAFWVPFYLVSGGLTLFDQSAQSDHWFGGLQLGVTSSRGIGSSQKVSYWSFALGTTLVL